MGQPGINDEPGGFTPSGIGNYGSGFPEKWNSLKFEGNCDTEFWYEDNQLGSTRTDCAIMTGPGSDWFCKHVSRSHAGCVGAQENLKQSFSTPQSWSISMRQIPNALVSVKVLTSIVEVLESMMALHQKLLPDVRIRRQRTSILQQHKMMAHANILLKVALIRQQRTSTLMPK